MHDRPGRRRGLPVALRALLGEAPGLQLPAAGHASGAAGPAQPALPDHVTRASRIIGEARVERALRHIDLS